MCCYCVFSCYRHIYHYYIHGPTGNVEKMGTTSSENPVRLLSLFCPYFLHISSLHPVFIYFYHFSLYLVAVYNPECEGQNLYLWDPSTQLLSKQSYFNHLNGWFIAANRTLLWSLFLEYEKLPKEAKSFGQWQGTITALLMIMRLLSWLMQGFQRMVTESCFLFTIFVVNVVSQL